MYEFEKHPKLTEFIQEMANTGRVPQEWTTFLETLNQALRIHDVVGRSEQLLDFIQWRKQVSVDDLTDKEIVEFYLARKVK